MPQVDFAPSMAALMGVPTPFGNIGRISRPLWNAAHSMASTTTPDGDRCTEGDDSGTGTFAKASRENAAQVRGNLVRPGAVMLAVVALGVLPSRVSACCRCIHISTPMQRTEEPLCQAGILIG